jgi:hypothetical protein
VRTRPSHLVLLLLAAGLLPACAQSTQNTRTARVSRRGTGLKPRLPAAITWCPGAPHVIPVRRPADEAPPGPAHFTRDVEHCTRFLPGGTKAKVLARFQLRVSTGQAGQVEKFCAWGASFDDPEMVSCILKGMLISEDRLDPLLVDQLTTFSFVND